MASPASNHLTHKGSAIPIQNAELGQIAQQTITSAPTYPPVQYPLPTLLRHVPESLSPSVSPQMQDNYSASGFSSARTAARRFNANFQVSLRVGLQKYAVIFT